MNAILKNTRTKKQVKHDNMLYAKARLDEILNQQQEIYCIIRHVSQSGMSRHISFFCIVDNEPRFLDGLISDYLDYRHNKSYTGLVVGGCGMDMAFSVVNHLQVQMTHDKMTTHTEYNFRHRII
jgi:hypothetical protein